MTQDEIIEMAMEEAEFVSHGKPSDEESELFVCTDKDIVLFYNLVAAKALRENAMREVQRLGQEIEQECWCTTCRPITMTDMRFVVCPDCDNKRCPKANDHRNACTNSNEVGQKGSSWEHVNPLAQPEQEPVKIAHKHEWFRTGEMKVGQMRCISCGIWGQEEMPQRTWVGLTNNELQPIADEYRILFGSWVEDFAKAIEAKLKERNT